MRVEFIWSFLKIRNNQSNRIKIQDEMYIKNKGSSQSQSTTAQVINKNFPISFH